MFASIDCELNTRSGNSIEFTNSIYCFCENMQYLGARGKICLLEVRIVCMSATTCLPANRCDMALFKYNLVGLSGERQKTLSSPHVNANLFLPWSSWGFGLWCLNATFSNIAAIPWNETGVLRESHRPTACHWQTLSYNVVSSTPRLKVNGDMYWLHR